jgi:hypothetical protein
VPFHPDLATLDSSVSIRRKVLGGFWWNTAGNIPIRSLVSVMVFLVQSHVNNLTNTFPQHCKKAPFLLALDPVKENCQDSITTILAVQYLYAFVPYS